MNSNQNKGCTFWNYFMFFLGLIFLFRFISYSISGDPLNLILSFMGLIMILPPLLIRNKYYNKIFSSVVLGIIIFSGLILGYTYLYLPMYVFSIEYITSIGFFIIYLVLFVYYYPKEWKGFLPKNN